VLTPNHDERTTTTPRPTPGKLSEGGIYRPIIASTTVAPVTIGTTDNAWIEDSAAESPLVEHGDVHPQEEDFAIWWEGDLDHIDWGRQKNVPTDDEEEIPSDIVRDVDGDSSPVTDVVSELTVLVSRSQSVDDPAADFMVPLSVVSDGVPIAAKLVFERSVGNMKASLFGDESHSCSIAATIGHVHVHPENWECMRFVSIGRSREFPNYFEFSLSEGSQVVGESARATLEQVPSGELGFMGSLVWGIDAGLAAPSVLLLSTDSVVEVPSGWFTSLQSQLDRKWTTDTEGRLVVVGEACGDVENEFPRISIAVGSIEVTLPFGQLSSDARVGCTIRITESRDNQFRVGAPFFSSVRRVELDMTELVISLENREMADSAEPGTDLRSWTDVSMAAMWTLDRNDQFDFVADMFRERTGGDEFVRLVFGGEGPGSSPELFRPSGTALNPIFTSLTNHQGTPSINVNPRIYFGNPHLVVMPRVEDSLFEFRHGHGSSGICQQEDPVTVVNQGGTEWEISGMLQMGEVSGNRSFRITLDDGITMNSGDYLEFQKLLPDPIRSQNGKRDQKRTGVVWYDDCPPTNQFPEIRIAITTRNVYTISPDDYVMRWEAFRNACAVRVDGVDGFGPNWKLGVPFFRNHVVKFNAVEETVSICTAKT
jgi:hypothetical protein